jgi:cleavage and polyadenylation specificity factor subunit 1
VTETLRKSLTLIDIELYGDSKASAIVTNTAAVPSKRSTIRLSLADSIPGYGSISDMTFAIAKNGVSAILFGV